jgi:hypothetical protein
MYQCHYLQPLPIEGSRDRYRDFDAERARPHQVWREAIAALIPFPFGGGHLRHPRSSELAVIALEAVIVLLLLGSINAIAGR